MEEFSGEENIFACGIWKRSYADSYVYRACDLYIGGENRQGNPQHISFLFIQQLPTFGTVNLTLNHKLPIIGIDRPGPTLAFT